MLTTETSLAEESALGGRAADGTPRGLGDLCLLSRHRWAHTIPTLEGAQVWHAARWVWSAGVAQRTAVGESEQVQSEMRRGKVAWVLPEVVSLHRGRL